MSKPTDRICPCCHKQTVDKDRRLCVNCGARLFWVNDQPETICAETEVSDQSVQAQSAGWFMFMRGPRGTGWYRRDAVKLFMEVA